MIKYFVRTTGERKLNNSYNQFNYELLIDKKHKPIDSFIEQLKIISDFDSVLVEDDIILCNDFKDKIEKVIIQYPNMIINFFTRPMEYFTTNITDNPIRFNQCTYYPKGISKKIADIMLQLVKNNTICGYDVIESWAMKKLNLVYVQYRPCLVQHNDIKSIINSNTPKRITPYFIDYLEELNINYEDAWKKENKEKLIKLMESKFKN